MSGMASPGFFVDGPGGPQPITGKRKLPGPSPDAELHPGDFVTLTETDPFYIGNHPMVTAAAVNGTIGRVLMKKFTMLSEKEQAALGVPTAWEVTVKFKGTPQPFMFWNLFLKKVERPSAR